MYTHECTAQPFETSPPLFPDFIDSLQPVHSGGTDRFKLWHLGGLPHKLQPPSDYAHLRGCVVGWEAPGTYVEDLPPWYVELSHYHQIFVGAGKKLEMRQRVNHVQRRFRERAACAAFAERLLRRVEACEARWQAHYHPEQAEAL